MATKTLQSKTVSTEVTKTVSGQSEKLDSENYCADRLRWNHDCTSAFTHIDIKKSVLL
jgi:hypothetical protein